jgi:hypothetical protein
MSIGVAGTDDMRAPDRVTPRPRSIFRPFLSDFPELSSGWPYSKSMYDEPIHAADRISVPGYRYLPVSREIYGYTPRNLYPAPYRPGTYWEEPWGATPIVGRGETSGNIASIIKKE